MMPTSQRSLQARVKAHRMHALHDGKETTEKARESFLKRFLDEVDPGHVLPEDERQRRAQHAIRAHMLRLSLRSVQARAKRKASMPPVNRPSIPANTAA